MITFRVGAFDAEVLEKEFAPVFTAEDLVNLGFTQIYLKLMIDGVSSKPFSARAMAPIQKNIISFKTQVVENSRLQFARKRGDVEREIIEWHGSQQSQPAPKQDQRPPHREFREDFPKKDVVLEQQKKEVFNEIMKSEKVENPVKKSDPTIDENKAAFLKASEDLRLKEKMNQEIKKMAESTGSVSLTSLKKDKEVKNPSRENISNLKAALSSVLVKQNNQTNQNIQKQDQVKVDLPKPVELKIEQPKKPEVTNQVQPVKPSPAQEFIPPKQTEVKQPVVQQVVQQVVPPPKPTQQFVQEKPAPVVEKVNVPPQPTHHVEYKKAPESHTERTEKREERSEPKVEMPKFTPKNEIPEDVLKKLLSLE
jgi:hypothetical protein